MQTNIPRPPAISVRYIYSACVKTTTPDVVILQDPWFTEGIYDGSWFHFPKVSNPIQSIGDCDLIFVSHVHPDHYDGEFLKQYFAAYGEKEVIIADHSPNHLANKMRVDRIKCVVLEQPRTIGGTTIEILPHKTGSVSDLDSALVVKYFDGKRVHCVANANDIHFDDAMRSKLKTTAGSVDILLCGYTGAGPYPQTYFDLNDKRLLIEADKKRLAFFERYKALTNAIDAKVNIPFAGQYILGGKLTALNRFRGVADAVEVLEIDKRAVVLADVVGEVDTLSLKPTAVRTKKYSPAEIEKREAEIKSYLMEYERLIPESEIHQLPIKRLLISAARRAHEKSECEIDYYFVFDLPNKEKAIVNANKTSSALIRFVEPDGPLPLPRSEMKLDPRYFFGLLTAVYHWNNNEIGSHTDVRRFPYDKFERTAQGFLNYLSVV